jgi:hypothetical protein
MSRHIGLPLQNTHDLFDPSRDFDAFALMKVMISLANHRK